MTRRTKLVIVRESKSLLSKSATAIVNTILTKKIKVLKARLMLSKTMSAIFSPLRVLLYLDH